MLNKSFLAALVFSLVGIKAIAQKVIIETESIQLRSPVTNAIAEKSIAILNEVFNAPEFGEMLSKYSFVCTNKPAMCDSSGNISGANVYAEFMKAGTISINLRVRRNLFKKISGTLGETPSQGNTITTYTWWLDDDNERDLVIDYATHVGHEIFHTLYFKYIHDPEYGSKNFVNDRDVTYKIDDILEELIKKYYQ